MTTDADWPNIEASVAEHDAEAIQPGSTEHDVDLVCAALAANAVPDGPLLDIACGSGRHLRGLAAQGHTVYGCDIDPRMIEAAHSAGLPSGCDLRVADASSLTHDGTYGETRFAAAILLNRSLVCFHSPRLAWGLFRNVYDALLPGGIFCIDNCCNDLWDEVGNGNYANGISGDGTQQLFFLPGDNRFVWRRDDQVDLDSWQAKPGDRIFRLWSLNEVHLAAQGCGFERINLASDDELLILKKPTNDCS